MITIRFGLNNQVTGTVSQYPTTRSVVSNAGLRSALGFGDNVEARVNGDAVGDNYALSDGDVVELVTRANSKG